MIDTFRKPSLSIDWAFYKIDTTMASDLENDRKLEFSRIVLEFLRLLCHSSNERTG